MDPPYLARHQLPLPDSPAGHIMTYALTGPAVNLFSEQQVSCTHARYYDKCCVLPHKENTNEKKKKKFPFK